MKQSMNDVLVSVFARTDTGMQRSHNEDAFIIADLTTGKIGLGPDVSTHRVGRRGSLMAVSDGMGGAAAGEIASEIAVKALRESLLQMPFDINVSRQLNKATEEANERVWQHAEQNPEFKGMGATLTAVLVHGGTAYVAQVGDSRAYLVRGEQIKQITRDQSFIQMLIDKGAIKPDQANSVPKNVILQALGTRPFINVALTSVDLYRNDYMIVCSDGLTSKIKADELRRTALESPDLTAACRRLVEIANQRGGEDNITVIVAKFDGFGLDTAADSGSITGSFKVINEDYTNEGSAGVTAELSSPPSAQPSNFETKALASPSPGPAKKTESPLPKQASPEAIQATPPPAPDGKSEQREGASVSHKETKGANLLISGLVTATLIILSLCLLFSHLL